MPNQKYEILEHPAESRLKIYGQTLEELFKNAAFALAEILKHDAEKIFKNSGLKPKTQKLKIKSVDINSLLVDFLSEILARSQINKCVYEIANCKLQIAKNKEASIIVGIAGFPVDHFDEDIKAITYQDLNIQKIDGIWQTILVFDI